MDWTDLAQERDQLRALVNAVMTFRVPWVVERLAVSQGLSNITPWIRMEGLLQTFLISVPHGDERLISYPACLTPGEYASVTTRYKAGWDREAVWVQWRKHLLPYSGLDPDFSVFFCSPNHSRLLKYMYRCPDDGLCYVETCNGVTCKTLYLNNKELYTNSGCIGRQSISKLQ
jgi:hypothetical protein